MCRLFTRRFIAVAVVAMPALFVMIGVGSGKEPLAKTEADTQEKGTLTTVVVDSDANVEHVKSCKGQPGYRAVYQINPDGSDLKFFIEAPGMLVSSDPQISHDGKLLVFCGRPSGDAVGEAQMFLTALDGPFKGVVRSYGPGLEPAWSPDDRRIVYLCNSTPPPGERTGLWIMDVDGSHRRFVTGAALMPRWSPDGKKLLCHTYDGGSDSLGLVDVDTGKITDLLSNTGWTVNNYGGGWAPDSRRIVFAGKHEGAEHLAILDTSAEADPIHILFTSGDPQVKVGGPPAWSPDGKQIVFEIVYKSSGEEQSAKSYLFSIAAEVPSGPLLLEGQMMGNINRGFVFSPDGKKLFFTSER